MSDGTAKSAASDTPSPPSPDSAKSATIENPPEVGFTFYRPKDHGKASLQTPVLGKRPYVVLEMTDAGLRVFGGGIDGEVDQSTISRFMLASGDAITAIGTTLQGET